MNHQKRQDRLLNFYSAALTKKQKLLEQKGQSVKVSASPFLIRDEGDQSPVRGSVAVRLEPAIADKFPTDICFVIDCSTWMHSGRVVHASSQQCVSLSKLEILRAALTSLSTELLSGNTISLVTFSETASVLATRITNTQAERYREAIESIQPKTGCRVAVGLRAAAHLLDACPANRSRRIILLTGGRIGDIGAPSVVVEELSAKQIGLDIVGIGNDVPLVKLRRLVKPNGGRICVTSDLDETTSTLKSLLDQSQSDCARDLRVQLQPPAGWNVSSYFSAGIANCSVPFSCSSDAAGTTLVLASVSSQSYVDIVYNFVGDKKLDDSSIVEFAIKLNFTKSNGSCDSIARQFTATILNSSRADIEIGTQELLSYLDRISMVGLVEKLLDAIALENRDDLEELLVEIMHHMERMGLPDGHLLVRDLLENCRNNHLSDNVSQNALLRYLDGIHREPIYPGSCQNYMFETDTDPQVASPETMEPGAAQSPTDGIEIAMLLLSQCKAALQRRDELHSKVASLESQIDYYKLSDPGDWKFRFLGSVQVWLDVMTSDDIVCVSGFAKALQELNDAAMEWIALAEKLNIGREEQEQREQLLGNLLETKEFYKWTDLGWAGNLKSLQQRREMLERISNRESDDERN